PRESLLSLPDALPISRARHRFHNRPVPVAPSLPQLHEFLEDGWVGDGYRDLEEERLYLDHGRQVLAQYHRENAEGFRIPAALELDRKSTRLNSSHQIT